MLQRLPEPADLPLDGEGATARSGGTALAEIVAFLQRRRAIIGTFIVLGLCLGLAYILISAPTYTSLSELILDAHKSPSGQPQTILGDPISDSAIVESQVEVLRSEGIARTVIKQLNLTQDSEFNGERQSDLDRAVRFLTSAAHRLFGAPARSGVDDKLATTLNAFERKLQVRRIGLGYVLEIRFNSEDPVKAARIANAVVAAYLDEALASKSQRSGKLDAWLQQKMADLRKKLTSSLVALQEFKTQHELVDSSQGALQNIAQLRDLEAVAHGYQAIYESFVNSYAETLRASSPSIEARVITQAIPPTVKSWPRTSIALPLALCLGVLIGLPIAFWRDQFDRKLRSASQVRDALGVRCLGLLPKTQRLTPSVTAADPAIWPAKVAVDVRSLSRPTKVIGVTSALPQEGKTTVATMLAMLSAKTGTRTLVIDACLENPTLTTMLAPAATTGFLDLLASRAALHTGIVAHHPGGLHLLPATVKDHSDREPGIASKSMQDVLEWARQEYDLVIVDLPSITQSPDVWASASLLEGVILVVEWGATDQSTVAEALRSLDLTNGQIIGVLLNKAAFAPARRARRRPGFAGPVARGASAPAQAASGQRRSPARSTPPPRAPESTEGVP